MDKLETDQKKETDKIELLANWIRSGSWSFMEMPAYCELPHCYNLPTVSMRNPYNQNRPKYICARCAKIGKQLAHEEIKISLVWENCHDER